MKKLASDLVSRMPALTVQRSIELALANAELNQPYIEHTITELGKLAATDESTGAIVVGAGPSLHIQDSIGQIVRSDYRGTVIAADGAMGHCLRNGLVPDYVVTVDPHTTRIGRWFGDTSLTKQKLSEDDYFRRQEMDPYMASDELARNEALVVLVNHHGPSIKAVIATSSSQLVTERCSEAGMTLYWWNPLYDDFDQPGSITRKVFNLNKVPCMVSGGNVGASAWIFAHAILKKKNVAVVGTDLGYAPGTPIANTQYFKEIEEIFGESAADAFIDVYNPYTGETWFTDPAYYWYRQSLLEMAPNAGCTTFNCTEGGILFGEGIEYVPLSEFLGQND